MTRTIAAGMLTAIQSQSSEILHLIELQFSGGTTRITTASRDITFQSNVFTAVGGLLGIENVSESADQKGEGARLVLSGVDVSIISAILSQNYIGRLCNIWLVHLDAAGQIVANPIQFSPWLMNGGFEVDEDRDSDGGTVTIRARVESPIARFGWARGIRNNLISHQRHVTGDTFFQNTPGIKPVFWGRPQPSDATKQGHPLGGGGVVSGLPGSDQPFKE